MQNLQSVAETQYIKMQCSIHHWCRTGSGMKYDSSLAATMHHILRQEINISYYQYLGRKNVIEGKIFSFLLLSKGKQITERVAQVIKCSIKILTWEFKLLKTKLIIAEMLDRPVLILFLSTSECFPFPLQSHLNLGHGEEVRIASKTLEKATDFS